MAEEGMNGAFRASPADRARTLCCSSAAGFCFREGERCCEEAMTFIQSLVLSLPFEPNFVC